MISKRGPDSVGGGVVAEIYRDLQTRTRFSGGGGVVVEIFRDLRTRTTFFPVTTGVDQSNYLNYGTFFTLTGHLEVTHQ